MPGLIFEPLGLEKLESKVAGLGSAWVWFLVARSITTFSRLELTRSKKIKTNTNYKVQSTKLAGRKTKFEENTKKTFGKRNPVTTKVRENGRSQSTSNPGSYGDHW
jgi:hypothetical protein